MSEDMGITARPEAKAPYELVATAIYEQAKVGDGKLGLTARQIASRTGLTVTHARLRAILVVYERGSERGAHMKKRRSRGNPMAFFWGDPTK